MFVELRILLCDTKSCSEKLVLYSTQAFHEGKEKGWDIFWSDGDEDHLHFCPKCVKKREEEKET